MGTILSILLSFGQDKRVVLTVDGEKYTVSQFRDYCKSHHKKSSTGKILRSDLNDFTDYALEKSAARRLMRDSLSQFSGMWNKYKGESLKEQFALSESGKASSPSAVPYYRVRLLVKHLPQQMPLREQNRWMARWDSIFEIVQQSPSRFVQLTDSMSDEAGEQRVREVDLPSELADVLTGMKPAEISRPLFIPQGVAMVQLVGIDRGGSAVAVTPPDNGSVRKDSLISRLVKICHATLDVNNLHELEKGRPLKGPLLILGKKSLGEEDYRFFLSNALPASRSSVRDFLLKSLLDYLYSSDDMPLNTAQCKETFVDSLCMAGCERVLQRRWNNPSKEDLQAFTAQNPSKSDKYVYEFDGILFRCRSKKEMKSVRRFLKRLPSSERMKAVKLMFQKTQPCEVVAVEGKFADGSNPYVDEAVFHIQSHSLKDGYPYAGYLGRRSRRKCTADELRLRSISRYRKHCLEEWHNSLRSNSMIEFNEEVIKSVNNGR